jgi:hypothetical protein
MTEKSQVPNKLSVARAYRRVAAMFHRRDDHRTTDDYQRASASSQEDMRREMRKGKATWEGSQGGPFGPMGGGF